VRVAVITGASSGIGSAAARRLDADGWRLILVARRAERLAALAGELRDAHSLPLDVTAQDAPGRLRARVEEEGSLDLLVNNAGAGWHVAFGDSERGGYANVRGTMELNLDAPVRLTEALLPILRASAPSAIVNVSSTAGRVGLPGRGAYCASKFALAGWTEALHFEERPNGVHVGLVLPGFTATEGFPQEHLRRRWVTRWIVSTPEKVAEAIVDAGPRGRPERYVPRAYGFATAARALLPPLWRRVAGRVRP
jgi:uncharacterized protein